MTFANHEGEEELYGLFDLFDQACSETESSSVPERFHRLYARLQDIVVRITTLVQKLSSSRADLKQEVFGRFAETVLSRFRISGLTERLWSKPRGHSGDYQIVEAICQGPTPLESIGTVMERLLTDRPMANQHRSKVAEQAGFVKGWLKKKKPFCLIDIGCGPAFDLRLSLIESFHRDMATFVLVDIDPEALNFSRQKLGVVSGPSRFQFVESDVISYFRHYQGPEFVDAILIGGLLDYLDDDRVIFASGKP
jgi:hypothetical protein